MQEDREQRTINKKNSNHLEKKVLTKLEENNENKNSLKHKLALKGISQDLLNKVSVGVTGMVASWLVSLSLE